MECYNYDKLYLDNFEIFFIFQVLRSILMLYKVSRMLGSKASSFKGVASLYKY